MNITPIKFYYIEPDKLYAYMVGVITIYSKYPQITPEIREQIEMDIVETIPYIACDIPVYGMSARKYTLRYIADSILTELQFD